jgi:hypothetical protein
VYPKAVEGLPEQGVLAESGLSAESTAAVSACEQARRQGHRVADGERGVMGGERKELLPEALFDLPEVGSLAAECGPMYLTEGGEPFSIVTTKEEVDGLVGIEPQELADDLYGEHFGVGELGGGSAASDAPFLELVVDKTEDGDDEGALRSIREDLLLFSMDRSTTEGREVFSLTQVLKETCTRG